MAFFYSDTLVSSVIEPTPLSSKVMLDVNKSFRRLCDLETFGVKIRKP